jgi:hypothetical protein
MTAPPWRTVSPLPQADAVAESADHRLDRLIRVSTF